MGRYKILVPIILAWLIAFGTIEFHRSAGATLRRSINEPVYTIADKDYSVALSNGKKVIKLGPAFWGLYPGAIAFKTPEEALKYMKKEEMNEKHLSIYRLSGNYESDVNQESEPHRINKSLMIIEKAKCE
jgi:hypothetical protein